MTDAQWAVLEPLLPGFVVNELIREAPYPYPADPSIVTKVGARRGEDGSQSTTIMKSCAQDRPDMRVRPAS